MWFLTDWGFQTPRLQSIESRFWKKIIRFNLEKKSRNVFRIDFRIAFDQILCLVISLLIVLQQCYAMTLATYSSTRGLRFPLTTIILLNRCPRPPCSYVTVKMQLVRIQEFLLQTSQQNIFHLFSSFSFRMRKKVPHAKIFFLEIRLWVKLQLSYVIIKMQLVRIQEFCFWVLLVKLKVGRLRWLGKRLELSRWRNWPSQEKMSITYGRVRPQKILAWFEVFCGKLYEFACLPRQDWWLRWCCSAWLRTRSSAPGLRAFDWGITLL